MKTNKEVSKQDEKWRKSWLATTFAYFIYPIIYLEFSIRNSEFNKDKFILETFQFWYTIVIIPAFLFVLYFAYKKYKNGFLICLLPLPFLLQLFLFAGSLNLGIPFAIWLFWCISSIKLVRLNQKRRLEQLLQKKESGHPLSYIESLEVFRNLETLEILDEEFKELREKWPQHQETSWVEYQIRKEKLHSIR